MDDSVLKQELVANQGPKLPVELPENVSALNKPIKQIVKCQL